jgi:tetratricopeptide (TPR) repeat protein
MVLILLWVVAAHGQESSPKEGTRPAPLRLDANPQEVATAYEKAGKLCEAATVYGELARTNSVARKVVAERLVTIYTQTGETNQALAWAKEVMRENPDPQAYLAEVQSRLGNWKEAEKILEREIAANTNATRAVTLRWQLAEVMEKTGEAMKARKTLEDAERQAMGTPMEAVARRRLDAAKQKEK